MGLRAAPVAVGRQNLSLSQGRYVREADLNSIAEQS